MPRSPPGSPSSQDTAVDSPWPPSFKPKWNLHHLLQLLNPIYLVRLCFEMVYRIVQLFIIVLFKPVPPKTPDQPKQPYGNIAVIGAGLSGVSSAAHAIAHNFDVTIYETNAEVGGIWAHVNSTSKLQLNSLLYRFHPAVYWKHTFPRRDEILKEIRRIWKEYQLESRTKFNTAVTSVTRAPSSTKPDEYGHARWMINETDGPYDAVIVTVGTCGKPKKVLRSQIRHDDALTNILAQIEMKGQETFKGKIVHSSELDDLELEGKRVVVIGSGASGVEAAELAVEKNAKAPTVILARDDKWIIPRNIFFDTLLSAQPFGRETPLSFIPEWFIKTFHYRDLKHLAPYRKGVFEGTPVVNSSFLAHVRHKKASYIRGDTQEITPHGVKITERDRGTKPGDKGEQREIPADIIVLATGFERPSIEFLPQDLFPERYQRPCLYLQNFATEDWSVLLTNSAYQNAIGTVALLKVPGNGFSGHFHIGIYTRILLVFLLDRSARPLPEDMKLWVDALRFVKRGAKGGALSFFTYMELTIWFITWHLFRPERLRWLLFIMQGWGVYWTDGEKGPQKRVE